MLDEFPRIIAGVPVIALFTLFELVIFNPKHHETRGNLALLDVAGGYFSRLEYASHGSLHSSLVSEFAYIAREYVNSLHKSATPATNSNIQPQTSPQGQESLPAPAMALPSPSVKGPPARVDAQQQVATSMAPTLPSLMSGFAADQGPPMIDGTEMMRIEDGLDFLQFPVGDAMFDMNNDILLGTDVMDLFSYSIPTIDPFFAQAFGGHENQMGE